MDLSRLNLLNNPPQIGDQLRIEFKQNNVSGEVSMNVYRPGQHPPNEVGLLLTEGRYIWQKVERGLLELASVLREDLRTLGMRLSVYGIETRDGRSSTQLMATLQAWLDVPNPTIVNTGELVRLLPQLSIIRIDFRPIIF